MTCSICNGPTASDAASVHWCVLCGANVTLQREKHPDRGECCFASILKDDTAEYKPLMAEELNQ